MISDDTLILYYYGDGLDDARLAAIEEALASDEVLAARYRELAASLDALARPDTPAAPAEAVVRWRYELDAAIANESHRWRARAWFASAAAVLALGIAIGLWLADGRQAPVPVATTPSEAGVGTDRPAAALTRGVSQYLHDSRLQLVGLQNADDERRVELITTIIEQNRLFEQAAERNGSPELARVLRAFEQMLRELARTEATPADVDSTSDRLAFEYAVMLTKLSRDSSNTPTSL